MRIVSLSLLAAFAVLAPACLPAEGEGPGEPSPPSPDTSDAERDIGRDVGRDASPAQEDTGGTSVPDTAVTSDASSGAPDTSDETPDVASGEDVCGRADVTVCDGFEGALDARYREINFGPSAVSIDTTRAHRGASSVKVESMGFTQMLATPVPASRFHVRLYLMSDTPMNMGHNTFINAGEGDGDPNPLPVVRVGEHRQQLELNRKSDDHELLSSGDYDSLEGATQLMEDTWYCLEVLYDGPGSQVRVWVDDEEVSKLHATDWSADYETFKFGYERYHGPDKTIWYDDLAMGTERIGCL